jgi:hypothetical protein
MVGDVQHTRKVRIALISLDGKSKYHVRDIGGFFFLSYGAAAHRGPGPPHS